VSSKTPETIVAKLHQLISEIVNGPAFQKYSRDTGNLPLDPMTLAETADFYKSETAKYTKVARAMKLTPQ
jgi:tripartite-type tricarboxylate transporter receptor subunit TctC